MSDNDTHQTTGPESGTRITTMKWWVSRPPDRDMFCLHLVQYTVEDDTLIGQAYLDGDGAWIEFADFARIEPALNISGRLLAGISGAPESIKDNPAVKQVIEAITRARGSDEIVTGEVER